MLFVFGLLANWVPTLLMALTVVVAYLVYHFIMHPVQHWFMNRGLIVVLRSYERLLGWSLRHRFRIVGGLLEREGYPPSMIARAQDWIKKAST